MSMPLPSGLPESLRRRAAPRRLAIGLTFAALWVAAPVAAQLAEPFRTRNLNPFLAAFPWPSWQIASTPGQTRFVAVTELANHYRFSAAGASRLRLDGETWRASLFWQHQFSEQWSVGFDLPWLRQSGGVFDDAIDAFHGAFALPDGGRNLRAEGLLEYGLTVAGASAFSLESTASGLGDAQISLARRLNSGDRPLLFQATLSLPTGDRALLSGTGQVGAALSLLHSLPLEWRARPAGLYWAAAAIFPGDPGLPGVPVRGVGYLGTVGGAWQPWPRVGFKLQLDLHSAFYRSDLVELGRAGAQATLGGWWKGRANRAIEVAINEDLRVGTSPDVVLNLAFRWSGL
jgi:hypothetical protein